MKDKVLDYCRREQVFRPGERVICALSGGADSVAMTHCLLQLRQELGIELAAAHFNHCLRGEASDGDEAFVRRLCVSWGLELAVGRGDAAAFAAGTGRSLEDAARQLRYGFLMDLPGVIAAAHHADDQTETVLLNLLRGTGLKGLAGMQPRQARLARPLLAVTRREIVDYGQQNGLEYRRDATNEEDDALRNRLRHHVIPLLQQENPDLAGTVTRMTQLLRQDEALLQAQTDGLLRSAAAEGGWDCTVLQQAPAVLRRRAVRTLLDPVPTPSMCHVDAVDGLLTDLRGSASVDLPGGWQARRSYGLLRVAQASGAASWPEVTLVPGMQVQLPGTDWVVSVEGPVFLEKSVDFLTTFALKYDMMKEPCAVTLRTRQTGDSLQLPGGTRSLKRLMIDRKIPAEQRACLPVLTDGTHVVAVCGLGADIRWAAGPGDKAWIVKIRARGEKQP